MRYLVYMEFDDGEGGYVIPYRTGVEAIVPPDGKHVASTFGTVEAANEWVQSLEGYAKNLYVSQRVEAYNGFAGGRAYV